ncbi:hypothetical protein BC567DRAFT_228725 [Phyllosticta citribraziliensis]
MLIFAIPSSIGLFLVLGGVLVGNTGKGLSKGNACGDVGRPGFGRGAPFGIGAIGGGPWGGGLPRPMGSPPGPKFCGGGLPRPSPLTGGLAPALGGGP